MDLREAGAAEREVPAAAVDEADQLGGVAEPALGLDEVALAARRVAAQREDVLDPRRLDLVERRRQPLGRLADAAEVGHRLVAELVLQPPRDLHRAVAGRAAGAVGDGDEVGLQVAQLARRLEQGLLSLGVRGGENSTEKVMRMLRAVQIETFLSEVKAFERSGQVSDELVAVAGPFVERMRAVGWCRGNRVLLDENERRVAYKVAWNGIIGVDRRPDCALSLDETRVLYGLYLRLPHAPESQIRALDVARNGARDVAACEALSAGEHLAAESWRLNQIGRLAPLDPTYPAAYAKGIAQFRMRKFPQR